MVHSSLPLGPLIPSTSVPTTTASSPQVSARQVSISALSTKNERVVLPVLLQWGSNTISTQAMIDTGAEQNIISESFAKRHGVPLEEISPIHLFSADEQPMSIPTITLATSGLSTTVSSGYDSASPRGTPPSIHGERKGPPSHCSTVSFLVANLPMPVILGIPWLHAAEPEFNWKHGNAVDFPDQPLDSPPPSASLDHHSVDPSSLVSQQLGIASTTAQPDPSPTLPSKYADFQWLFDKDRADKLPTHRSHDHAIPLRENSMPPFGPIYSLSEAELKALDIYLKDNLAKGFIQESTSPAAAPLHFVPKKDGSLRPVIDYRGLNNVTVKDRYTPPRIPDLIDRLQGAKIFTRLDLRGAYNLVRIKPGDEWKTAFRTRYGLYEYKVMPFGLCNAPATFQRLINTVLRPFLDVSAVAYLDDILIFSTNKDDHPTHVRQVLSALAGADLFVKLEKCLFDVTTVEFLGSIVSTNGITVDPSRIDSISTWPTPKTVKQLQSFLGFCNWSRHFIDQYSDKTAVLTCLLKKGVPFVWGDAQQIAFQQIKDEFRVGRVLAHFDPSLPCTLETDASDKAIAAILYQPDDSKLRPVSFFSRTLIDAELNYQVSEKELLAIVDALKHWRHYLEGGPHQITVLSDHANLLRFTTTKSLNRREARWSLELATYDFCIQHVPGNQNARADAISRRADYMAQQDQMVAAMLRPEHFKPSPLAALHASPSPEPPDNSSPPDSTPLLEFNDPVELSGDMEQDLATALQKDQFAREALQALAITPDSTSLPDKFRNFSRSPTGLLQFKDHLYVPRDKGIQQALLQRYHNHPLAGHFGAAKTFQLLSRSYFWPGLRRILDDYIAGCLPCQQNKPSRHAPYGSLASLPIPDRPWDSISIDFIVKLPPSLDLFDTTFDSILVVVDRFSKMALFIPCRESMDATTLAKLLFTFVFSKHGFPLSIVSDRGSLFTSPFFKELSTMLGISQKLSTAYHPQTDGQTERTNATLEQYLRMYVSYKQDDWVHFLPFAEFAVNNASASSTKESPFFVNTGRHPRFDMSISIDSRSQPAVDFASSLTALHSYLKLELQRAQDSQAHFYNESRSTQTTFDVGDMVFLNRKNISTTRPSLKLDHKKLGPFKILKNINNRAYQLSLPATWGIHDTFHISLLEKHLPSQMQPVSAPPPAIQLDTGPQFEIEAILDHRIRRKRTQYLVKWLGYPDEDNTWEPTANLHNASDLLNEYKAKRGGRTIVS